MIPGYWTSALANHLWQSTIVATAAALLAFALRKNPARMRYWLWLAASAKFLIPFSLLIAAGSRLTWTAAAPIARPQISAVIGQITQPFPDIGPAQLAAPVAHHHLDLPTVLLGTWICGFVIVAFSWWRIWRRIRASMRTASPISIETNVPVLSTPALLEPGVFGIVRPVLLLPEGITERLSLAQLKAVIAHELCHVRRRDNLAAAFHMAVEAIFWFHPLVWWVGLRMVEERERACDEEVLRLGSEPLVYAESILKTCQFYLESPLVCVSGITGSDLKKRMVRIMTQGFAEKLSFSRKVLLACAGAVIIAVPVLFGLSNASQNGTQSQTNDGPLPTFDVASVKPNHSGDNRIQIGNTPGSFRATNVTPKMLIEFAYDIKDPELSGGPSWINTERYDIDAKVPEAQDNQQISIAGFNPSFGAGKALTPEFNDMRNLRRRQMVQALLADRFKLTVTHETKQLPIYNLVVAKGGPKFHETTTPPPDPAAAANPPEPPRPGQPGADRPFRGRGIRMAFGRGQLDMNGAPMSAFANALSDRLGRNVLDKTELKGNYDLSLKWTPEEGEGGAFFGGPPPGRPAGDAPPPPDPSGPSIFTALQEQLGLKLESAKGPVETLVIASIEKPSEN